MKLLTSRELAKATNLDMPGGVFIAEALMQIFRYNKLNRVYSSAYDNDPIVFINSILDQLDIKYEVPEKDFENILEDCNKLMKENLKIPDNYTIIHVTGGASTQFALGPINFNPNKKKMDYVDTGEWY